MTNERSGHSGAHLTSSNCGSHRCVKLNLTNQALLTTSAEAIASLSVACLATTRVFANLSLAVSIHGSRSDCLPDDCFSNRNQCNVAKFSQEMVLKDRGYRWVIL
jgi:hypothetical protein